MGCTANSEMVRQLVRRWHLLAPLPYHRTAGLSRVEMLNLAFDHLDLDGSGELSYPEIIGFCRGLNPIKVHAEVRAMMRQMDKDGDGSISRAEYLEYMGQLVDILGDEEFERGVLETLATKPLISDLPDREAKLTALFRHLDADASGDLEIDELMPAFMSATPGADAAVDPIVARRDAKAQLAYLDEDGGGTVDLREFIDAMTFLTSYLSDEDFDAQMEEQMSTDRFTYKCDAAFLGRKGVLALIPVFRADRAFTHLVLRGCGVRNAGVAELCEALAGHPTLEFLDIGENPISEGGVDAIVALVESTPTLKHVAFDGCYFTRGWSDTSENLEGDPRTGGEPIRAAVARNRRPPPPVGEAAVAMMDVEEMLRARRGEVKALFHDVAGEDGKVSFDELRRGLMARSEDWRAVAGPLAEFISPEHIFGLAPGTDTADLDGDGLLSYAEFRRALGREGTRAKVLDACKKRRVQLKVVFYALAGTDGKLTVEELADGIEGVLTEQSEDMWGFTAEEMRAVINARLFEDADFDGDGELSWNEFFTKLNATR